MASLWLSPISCFFHQLNMKLKLYSITSWRCCQYLNNIELWLQSSVDNFLHMVSKIQIQIKILGHTIKFKVPLINPICTRGGGREKSTQQILEMLSISRSELYPRPALLYNVKQCKSDYKAELTASQ